MQTIAAPSIVTCRMSANLAAGLFEGTLNDRLDVEVPTGTANGSIDLIYAAVLSVATGVPFTLDLTALPEAGTGSPTAMSKLTHCKFQNLSVTPGEDFALWGAANGVFGATADPKLVKAKGGCFFWCDPEGGVTIDGTHKIFQAAVAAGAAVAARLSLWGRRV